jgi:hypothetical protein
MPWDDITRLLHGNDATGVPAPERAKEFHYAFTLDWDCPVSTDRLIMPLGLD